jgi:Uma2 family endonuclease
MTGNPPKVLKVPPLENGDHLTVEEFERRYEAMPHLKKAELIDGIVYMPSPVSYGHADEQFNLIGWLWLYRSHTPGVGGGDNATLRLPRGMNRPQPDVCLRIVTECGGRSHVDDDGYLAGAPELIAEVAASSASYDLHQKLRAYERNEVSEYLVWRVFDAEIDWFILRGDAFQPMAARGGVFKSKAFPGLWLDVAAMIGSDLVQVRNVLDQGLASPEHRRFVKRLARQRRDG